MALSGLVQMLLLTVLLVASKASPRSLPTEEHDISDAAPSAFATLITPDPNYQPLMYVAFSRERWNSSSKGQDTH